MERKRLAPVALGGWWVLVGAVVLLVAEMIFAPAPVRGGGQAAPGCEGGTPAAASPVAAGTAEAEGMSGQFVTFGETEALLFGAGDYGIVLSHGAVYDAESWRPQAEAIAGAGMVALSLEQNGPEHILAGIQYLQAECSVADVAVIGASAGGSTALRAASQEPELIDQLILLSSTGDVSGLGDFPKLFVASEGEGMADAVQRMADEAPGSENEALLLLGSAHAQAIFDTEQGDRLLTAILDRLDEYR